jgi:hypothetical protein
MKNIPNVIQSSEIQSKLIETLKELNDKFGLDLGSAIISDCRLVLHLLFRSEISYDISVNGQNAARLYRFLRDTWIESYEEKIPDFKDYSDNFDLKDLEVENIKYFESYYLAFCESPEKRDQCLKLIDSFLFVLYEGLDLFNPEVSSPGQFYSFYGLKDFDYQSEIIRYRAENKHTPEEILKDFAKQLDNPNWRLK